MSGSYDSLGGDSGSPIFNDQNGVNLFGIHNGVTCQVQLDGGIVLGFFQNNTCPTGSSVYKIFSSWESVSNSLRLR